jgi:hypothetical protein
VYFHKVENPDGSEKTGTAAQIAQQYSDFVETVTATIANRRRLYRKSNLNHSPQRMICFQAFFTKDFIDKIGTDSKHKWYNTTDGKKHDQSDTAYVNCAANADTTSDTNACDEMSKSIKTSVDAAMDLYNLYIIAADMSNENNSAHSFDFNSYFAGHEDDAAWFAYILDSEDFYEKGDRATQVKARHIPLPNHCWMISSPQSTNVLRGTQPLQHSASHMQRPSCPSQLY